MKPETHGIGLLSGGLDSALAAKVVQDAGARVTCLHFFTGFCLTGHHSRVGRTDRRLANPALEVGAMNDIRVELIDISRDYLPMVLAPRHGYGANMNPCIDCRVFMLRRARQYMEEVGADFVFTGEVLGQRAMSQKRSSIDLIEREAGLEGKLLRPLSARLLKPTQVEIDGRIDRDRLLAITGRSRAPQIELARKYGLTDYMAPAGGCCFLADPGYSSRLRDFIQYLDGADLTMDDVYLLGVGRHFRLPSLAKVIVGRNEIENHFLDRYAGTELCARAVDLKGPTAIATGARDESDIRATASIVARYGKGRVEDAVTVAVSFAGGTRTLVVPPAVDTWLDQVRI